MISEQQHNILARPVSNLGLSRSFCAVCEAMEVRTMLDIISSPRETLYRHPRFTYHWLAELTKFLEENDLADLLHTSKR